MINLAWGGHNNGSIPADSLTAIDAAGHLLEPDTAADWAALKAACHEATGIMLAAGDAADSCYRTLAQQDAEYTAYRDGTSAGVAAVPGTSNHGYGRAIDLTGYQTAASGWSGSRYVNSNPAWQWLLAHAAEYGFSWATGEASRESWHWEHTATSTVAAVGAVHLITEGDDDMNVIANSTTNAWALAGPGVFAPIPAGMGEAFEAVYGPHVAVSADVFTAISAACLTARQHDLHVIANTGTNNWVVGGFGTWYPIPGGQGDLFETLYGPHVAVDPTTFATLQRTFTGK